jgi:hypothetical protein
VSSSVEDNSKYSKSSSIASTNCCSNQSEKGVGTHSLLPECPKLENKTFGLSNRILTRRSEYLVGPRRSSSLRSTAVRPRRLDSRKTICIPYLHSNCFSVQFRHFGLASSPALVSHVHSMRLFAVIKRKELRFWTNLMRCKNEDLEIKPH